MALANTAMQALEIGGGELAHAVAEEAAKTVESVLGDASVHAEVMIFNRTGSMAARFSRTRFPERRNCSDNTGFWFLRGQPRLGGCVRTARNEFPIWKSVASFAGIVETRLKYPVPTRIGGFGGADGLAQYRQREFH